MASISHLSRKKTSWGEKKNSRLHTIKMIILKKYPRLSEPVIKPSLKITKKYQRSTKEKKIDILALFEKLQPYYSSKRLAGKGSFGSTYLFSGMKPGFIDSIASSARGHVIRGSHLPTISSCIAVKVITHNNTRDVFSEFDREVYILNYMQRKKKSIVRKRTFKASDHVPQLYLACHLPGVSLIIESCGPGKPLTAYSKLTAEVIAKLEYAVLSLWLSGVSHTDLTGNNIMYDEKTMKITIIDFGRAVLLSRETVNFIKRNLITVSTNPSRKTVLLMPNVLKTISKNIVSDSAKKAYAKYKIKGHFDDETMIQRQISRCLKSTCSRESLAKERLATWITI